MLAQKLTLTREAARDRARTLLVFLDKSRSDGTYRGHWSRFWELVQEAKAAGLKFTPTPRKAWDLEILLQPTLNHPQLGFALTNGNFTLPTWPADAPDPAQVQDDLVEFLNWAEVPAPSTEV